MKCQRLNIFFIDSLVWPPLWSSDQSSSLQIQRYGFDSRRYEIFSEVVGLERDQLSLVSTTEKILGRKSSGSGLVNRQYSRRGIRRADYATPPSRKSWH
jgi:hypothetical protein